MARRRRYSGMVSLPLGGLKNLLPNMSGSVRAMDVVIGGAVAFVGANVLDMLLSRFVPTQWASVKTSLGKALPLAVGGLTSVAVGAIGKKIPGVGSKAGGFAVGALAFGVAMTAQNFLRGVAIPGGNGATFAEVVALPLGNYSGLLVDNPAPMNGLLVDNPAPARANLAALGQLSLGDDEYDGMDALAGMGG
jgi:hypothetical protein